MVAEFDANLNHLRTREGMAKAHAKGRLEGNGRNSLWPRGKRSTADITTPRRREPCPPRRGIHCVGRATIHRIVSSAAPRVRDSEASSRIPGPYRPMPERDRHPPQLPALPFSTRNTPSPLVKPYSLFLRRNYRNPDHSDAGLPARLLMAGHRPGPEVAVITLGFVVAAGLPLAVLGLARRRARTAARPARGALRQADRNARPSRRVKSSGGERPDRVDL